MTVSAKALADELFQSIYRANGFTLNDGENVKRAIEAKLAEITLHAQPSREAVAQPVAFRWKYEGEKSWIMTENRPPCADNFGMTCEPLYALPSSDGLRETIERCAKVCDEVVERSERLMSDPKADRMILASMTNGAMECAENIRALAGQSPTAQEGVQAATEPAEACRASIKRIDELLHVADSVEAHKEIHELAHMFEQFVAAVPADKRRIPDSIRIELEGCRHAVATITAKRTGSVTQNRNLAFYEGKVAGLEFALAAADDRQEILPPCKHERRTGGGSVDQHGNLTQYWQCQDCGASGSGSRPITPPECQK